MRRFSGWLRDLMQDARDLDPEVRRERVKLVVGVVTAIGVTVLIGSTATPLIDPAREFVLIRSLIGAALGITLILGAFFLLRYIKRKE